MKNKIYTELYRGYTINILKSGSVYFGEVRYGDKVHYKSKAKSDSKYLLRHLKWWVRERGNRKGKIITQFKSRIESINS